MKGFYMRKFVQKILLCAAVSLPSISYGSDELVSASGAGDVEKVEALIKDGADINFKNQNGFSPLIWATIFGKKEVVALLLENGANVDIQDMGGNTPLMLASSNGDIAIMNLLLDKHANIDIADIKGFTPFINSARAGKVESLKLLLDKGANINSTDRGGNTALMAHILNKSKASGELIIFLIARGIDINATNNDGYTALTLVVADEAGEILDLLLKNNADRTILPKGLTIRSIVANNKEAKNIIAKLGENFNPYIPEGYEIDPIIMKNAKAKCIELDGENFVELIFLEQDLKQIMKVAYIYKENNQYILANYEMHISGDGSSPDHFRFLTPLSNGGANKHIIDYK